jgi:ferredoxin-NADP reductase
VGRIFPIAGVALERELYMARLERKDCLSEVSQCYHFEFVLDGLESFPFNAGQFISAVADDANGKQQTRAYSLASAPRDNRFDLCVNRVEEGFFSNHLADLPDLPIGATIQVHGPHGHFILNEPVTDSILVATGTGVAPMRGFTQWLFPADGPDRSNGKQIWLVYGTRYESDIYYREEFEALARRKTNFHYLPTLSRAPESWSGLRGYVQEHVAKIVEERAARLGLPLPQPEPDPAIPRTELRFNIYAYVCGLNNMVASVRERLAGYGWHRKQIVFERYD